MKEITPKNVMDFADWMSKEYDIKVIGKGGKIGKLGMFLLKRLKHKKLGIAEFLDRFSFALPGAVKLSFDPGDTDCEQTLVNQVATICHEFTHAAVQWRDNKFLFVMGYFLSKRKRAWYEARAKVADMELHHAFGYDYTVRGIVGNMGAYRLDHKDIQTIYKHLETINKMTKQGHYSNTIVKHALKWWDID